MVAANALAVVRQALHVSHGIDAEELSGYYLADELAGNYRAVDVLVQQATWQALAALMATAFWGWCGEVAARIRPAAFTRQPRGPKRPQPKRASGKKHAIPTHRLLARRTEEQTRCWKGLAITGRLLGWRGTATARTASRRSGRRRFRHNPLCDQQLAR